MKILRILALFLSLSGLVYAQELQPIKLPAPQRAAGKPLMQALNERKSSREFSPKEIKLEVLSNLLWAANGINRPESAHRTAPSAMNMQEIDIYVATADGLYLYDALANQLLPIASEDMRELTGKQPFVKDAPLNLVYVADLSKMSKGSVEDKNFYAATDTGFISQNVYLYCASAGLNTVVRGSMDRDALREAMKLRPEQKIILAQTVGYPETKAGNR